MTSQKADQIFERQEYHQSLMDKMSIESSSVDTCRPEGEKTLYIEKLEQRIKSLKSIVEDMTEKSKNLEKRFRTDFEEDRKVIEDRYRTLKERMNIVRQAGGDAWKELGKGTSSALEDFTAGIKNAVSKFK
jgi:predicted RNase H-like nuclease (RuvC/YqgF family)